MNSNITDVIFEGSAFSFLPFLNMSPGEAHAVYKEPVIRRMVDAVEVETRWVKDGAIYRYKCAVIVVHFLTPS